MRKKRRIYKRKKREKEEEEDIEEGGKAERGKGGKEEGINLHEVSEFQS